MDESHRLWVGNIPNAADGFPNWRIRVLNRYFVPAGGQLSWQGVYYGRDTDVVHMWFGPPRCNGITNRVGTQTGGNYLIPPIGATRSGWHDASFNC